MNTGLRILLLVWVFGYLFVSCAPILGGHLVIGSIALVGGILLFVPWLVGALVIAFLIWSTNPPRRR